MLIFYNFAIFFECGNLIFNTMHWAIHCLWILALFNFAFAADPDIFLKNLSKEKISYRTILKHHDKVLASNSKSFDKVSLAYVTPWCVCWGVIDRRLTV